MTRPGVEWQGTRVRFAVRAPAAERLWLCLFDGEVERRLAMDRAGPLFVAEVQGLRAGQHYGYRADGPWEPQHGLWFDPAKLLVDPHAVELHHAFVQHPALGQRRVDTSRIVPRAVLQPPSDQAWRSPPPPIFKPGGLIYELNVRGFTMRHPQVPEAKRGTIAALAEPCVIDHLKRLRVAAVELMPIVAWIDERHLPPLGLRNAWGYNPVVPMAIDPRLAPGGVAELRDTVAALKEAGIGTILDMVLNHSGESDEEGGMLAFRGLDDSVYARDADGRLRNHAGTGNMFDFGRPHVRELMLDTLRHFVRVAGVDGFRFDLAPIMARGPKFDAHAPIFKAIAADPVLADRVMIAEPWDIGPGGYRLGEFPAGWLEWNDRYRDDVRRFWRGDEGMGGALATRIAGSSDLWGPERSRSVNFVAAHDGFTLADLVSHQARHNGANGEANRDGHGENHSWNNGLEGASDDPPVRAARMRDMRALLATLFLSRGTIMLTAGDEFGRSQGGNNNAYAQDNEVSWIDWINRDVALEAFVVRLAGLRARLPEIGSDRLIDRAEWRTLAGETMEIGHWHDPQLAGFELHLPRDGPDALVVRIDRRARRVWLVVGGVDLIEHDPNPLGPAIAAPLVPARTPAPV